MEDKQLDIEVSKDYETDVYLSCSWRKGEGRDAPWLFVKELDKKRIRVVSDVFDLPEQNNDRIARIMSTCSGYLAVLPFRNEESSTTSKYIIREIQVAARLNLPLAIAADSRVKANVDRRENGSVVITFGESPAKSIEYKSRYIGDLFVYKLGDNNLEAEVSQTIGSFTDYVLANKNKLEPYAFLITRLEKDFAEARMAIRAAVENEAGVPCLWSDDGRHTTNVDSIRERTRLLIRDASFVVADLTLDDPDSARENPSRAHEVGMALAHRKKIFIVSQDPRRYPYYSIDDHQIVWWNDEEELFNLLADWIRSEKRNLGRGIYNWRLHEKDAAYKVEVSARSFVCAENMRFVGPHLLRMTTLETAIIAISFGVLVYSLSVLLGKFWRHSDNLDPAAILAAVVVTMLSTNTGRTIGRQVGSLRLLKWVLPISALVLFVLSFA